MTEAAGTPAFDLPEMAAGSWKVSDILPMVAVPTSLWRWQVRLLVGLVRNVEEQVLAN